MKISDIPAWKILKTQPPPLLKGGGGVPTMKILYKYSLIGFHISWLHTLFESY